jgi:carbamoyltransferase
MLSVSAVRPEQRDRIPAVTHVDGTARLHLVRPEINPRFAALLHAFEQKTGVPILLNTSFNRRGEPIVATPEQALDVFMWTGLDCLVLENLLVEKKA